MKEEMCETDIMQKIRNEFIVDGDIDSAIKDYRKWCGTIAMFRHLDIERQDQIIETASEFPTLKSYLLEIQVHDGRSWK